MKFFGILLCSVILLAQPTQETDKEPAEAAEASPIESIEKLLTAQVQSWNNKDIEGFMSTYWNSPKLTFSAGGTTTRGWQATLDRYKKKYPPEKMGTLNFHKLEVSKLSDEVALVIGNWHLKWTDKPESKGNFSIVLKKIDGHWKIVHDHSSSVSE